MIMKWIKGLIEKYDHKNWQQWTEVVDDVENRYGVDICQITLVRQQARTGTKAYVRWMYQDDSEQAVWVSGCWPSKGDYIVGSGEVGYGKHHDEEVFYFNKVEKVIKKRVYSSYLRHQKRLS